MRSIQPVLLAVLAAAVVGRAPAQEPRAGRPRMIIGTRPVAEPPAPPTVLDVMPRVVDPAPAPPPVRLPIRVEDLLRVDMTPVVPAAAHSDPAPVPEPARLPITVAVQPAPVPAPPPAGPAEAPAGVTWQKLAAVAFMFVLVMAAVALFLRRRGSSLLTIQVVNHADPLAPAAPRSVRAVAYVPPEPNFELGPTYGEEAEARREADARQAAGVLERIADENVNLLAELDAAGAASESAAG